MPADERLARAALASARLPNRIAHGSRALLSGLWLGLLSDAGLRRLDELYYEGTDLYRTKEWNERGLFDWESDLVERHLPPGGRVLVAACGGGREVLALLEAGFDAVGYEPHAELADYGRRLLSEHGHPARVHPAPRDELPAGPADALILGWGAYSLVHGRARRVALLAPAVRILPSGAPLLLSFFHRTGDTRELRLARGVANALRRAARREPVELGDTLAPNRVRLFSEGELRDELREAGLEPVEYRVVGRADDTTAYAAAVARVP